MRPSIQLAALGLAVCLACQAAVADEVAPVTPGRSAPPVVTRAPTSTVLWTSPPTVPPTPVPTPVPAPIVLTATPRPTPTPSPTPSPRPTATPDPFQWTRYRSDAAGWAISVPSAWGFVDRAAALPRVDVAVSPETPHRTLDEYGTLATVKVWRSAGFTDVTVFADVVQRTSPAVAIREAATHPTAGTVVLLKYVVLVVDAAGRPTSQRAQQIDALFVSSGTGVILGLRSPVERIPQNAPLLEQIFARFAPGSPGSGP